MYGKNVKKNYYDHGIKIFWLDEAEPEFGVYDFDNYRYHLGPDIQIGNIYPQMYSRTFYEGMSEEGQENIVNLVRCAWAGSQRYGALVWSGDVHSTYEDFDPVAYENMKQRSVYLPDGAEWTDLYNGQVFKGGQNIVVDAPLEKIPVFIRDGKHPEFIGKLNKSIL